MLLYLLFWSLSFDLLLVENDVGIGGEGRAFHKMETAMVL